MMRLTCLTAVFSLGVLAATPSLSLGASPPSLGPVVMDLGQVREQVARMRAKSPEAFRAVARVAAQAQAIDRQRRGPYPVMAPMFRAIGPDALFPMLELLSNPKPPTTLRGRAWVGLRVGLIEAVGTLQDPRAAPVLKSILESEEKEYHVLRAAAAALGRIGDDASVTYLVTLASQPGRKEHALLSGLGECRRLAAARALASHLTPKSSEDHVIVVVRSLGSLGARWAWETPRLASTGEGNMAREVAARSLVEAFVAGSARVRAEATKALLIVDSPSTVTLIEEAKRSANTDTRLALDRLAARVANSPMR
ncbi:MAG: HEAT repeat domain-containing protein [Deltaproteobacteria bacterium]|nr:HEAT repeat domain-containing protein [Deltaproteobacteria bacterium]